MCTINIFQGFLKNLEMDWISSLYDKNLRKIFDEYIYINFIPLYTLKILLDVTGIVYYSNRMWEGLCDQKL